MSRSKRSVVGIDGGAVLFKSAVECLFRALDPQRFLSQRLDHLECQKAENIHDILSYFPISDHAEARPLPEPVALSSRESGLPGLGPFAVFLSGHVLGALISKLQTPQLRLISFRCFLTFHIQFRNLL